jgi:hypothetical protein
MKPIVIGIIVVVISCIIAVIAVVVSQIPKKAAAASVSAAVSVPTSPFIIGSHVKYTYTVPVGTNGTNALCLDGISDGIKKHFKITYYGTIRSNDTTNSTSQVQWKSMYQNADNPNCRFTPTIVSNQTSPTWTSMYVGVPGVSSASVLPGFPLNVPWTQLTAVTCLTGLTC